MTRRVREDAATPKVLIERGRGRILGAHVLGPSSVELIDQVVLAIRSEPRKSELERFTSGCPYIVRQVEITCILS